jgi:hypothetical protein
LPQINLNTIYLPKDNTSNLVNNIFLEKEMEKEDNDDLIV